MNKKPKRRFVFVDESGDAGFPGISDYFQINVLIVDEDALPLLESEISLYKYFLGHYGELKKKVNIKNTRILNLLVRISELDGVYFYHYTIKKSKYDGPHKHNAVRLSKLMIKNALRNIPEIVSDKNIIFELVIDRFLESREQDNALFKYLNDQYKKMLPRFAQITQVNSKYCYPIQILDALGTFVVKNEITNIDSIREINIINDI